MYLFVTKIEGGGDESIMAKAKPKVEKVAAKASDHREDLERLRRIKGQVEGIERMIEQGRYCLDIVHQMRSVMAAMKSVEGLVMERHIRHCVKDAIEARNEKETQAKISELLTLFNKR